MNNSVSLLKLCSTVVEVSPPEGILPAYLQESVRLTLRPSLCEHYICTISYELITNECENNQSYQ